MATKAKDTSSLTTSAVLAESGIEDVETSSAGSKDVEDVEDVIAPPSDPKEKEEWFSPAEDDQMSKARTIYVHRKLQDLENSLPNENTPKTPCKPVAGAIFEEEDGRPAFYALSELPKKRFAWRRVTFDDSQGSHHCGSWCAPIEFQEPTRKPPQSMNGIKKKAKMAALAMHALVVLRSRKSP